MDEYFHRITAIGLLTLLAAATVPAHALEVVGERLEIFGVFHGSVDYMDSDVGRATADADTNDRLVAGDFGVSSNASRIGFKGRHRTHNGVTALFELGQTVHLDGSSGDTFTSRNSFVGLGGERAGEILFGRHDTPFKIVGSDYTLFKDTVADLGALLGSGADEGGRTRRNPGSVHERPASRKHDPLA